MLPNKRSQTSPVHWNNSSLPEVFLGKGVLKICSKFTGELPCQSVISIKLQSNFIEITLQHECSPVNLLLIFRTSFYKNASGGLLLTEILFAKLNGDNLIPINSSRFFHYPDRFTSNLIYPTFLWKLYTITNPAFYKSLSNNIEISNFCLLFLPHGSPQLHFYLYAFIHTNQLIKHNK